MTEAKFALAGVAGAAVVRALFATIRVERVRIENLEQFRRRRHPVIFVFWHGVLLPLAHCHREEGIVVLVSEHSDGEYIARILLRNGFGTARGSSTRGGVRGMRALIRAARAGHDLALTPDGPRGPQREFKRGALAVAQLTGLPIIPLSVRASSAWVLDTWDHFIVPKPFSTIAVECLAPRFVPRDASPEQLDMLSHDIARDLDEAEVVR